MTRFSLRHPARSLSLRYKLWRVRRRIIRMNLSAFPRSDPAPDDSGVVR